MTFTGSITSGSPVVSGIADTTGLLVDMLVEASGIPSGTRIASIDSASQITLNNPSSATNGSASIVAYSLFAATYVKAEAFTSPTDLTVASARLFALGTSVVANVSANLTPYTQRINGQASVAATLTGNMAISEAALASRPKVAATVNATLGVTTSSVKAAISVVASINAASTSMVGIAGKASCAASTTRTTLSLSDSNISGTLQVSASATGTTTERYTVIIGRSTVSTALSGDVNRIIKESAKIVVEAIAKGTISGDATLTAVSSVVATTEGYLTFEGQGLGVCDVINDILLLWGIEDARLAVEHLRGRALNDLNAAMQLIWSRAKDLDYFSRKTITVTLSANNSSYEFDPNIQSVVGPVRRANGRQALRPLASRSQFDLFGHIFLGQTGVTVATAYPQAFFIERLTQNRPDNARVILHVVPTPFEETQILVDVAMECPRYTWKDYCYCVPLYIPHRYVETLLLPICRKRATSCQYFAKPDSAKTIEDEYNTAMQMLGMLDPQIKEVSAAEIGGEAK